MGIQLADARAVLQKALPDLMPLSEMWIDCSVCIARNGDRYIYVYHGKDVWIFSKYGVVTVKS